MSGRHLPTRAECLPLPLMRRDPETGAWTRVPPPPRADLMKHAERWGTDCVAETAAEFMDEEGLATLIERLDVIDLRRLEKSEARSVFKTKRKKLKPADVRARALLGIEEEDETE